MIKVVKFMHFSAVQHERKPMLDKKEAPLGAAATNIATSVVTGNALNNNSSAQTGYSQSRVGQKPGFWRGDFVGNQNENSNISNMFPVNFSFAELTSTLAQRGSKYKQI